MPGLPVLPLLAHAVVSGAESVCAAPAATSIALLLLSVLEVSLFGCCMLAAGVWTLMAPSRYGKRLLRRASPTACAILLTWQLAVYLVTSLQEYAFLPDWLETLGLFMFSSPPPVFLGLAGQLLAVLTLAGLSAHHVAASAAASATPATAGRLDSQVGHEPGLERGAEEGEVEEDLMLVWQQCSVAVIYAIWYVRGFALMPATRGLAMM